ncbi:acetate kinase [Actinomadura craniellae]|uniref:Acetate kinase n=1 Tax=Actinomadura craniellae TaxID=2231787 RepID=A0A365HDL2_9ACTN|nr:acetate kinase [Actinomadura craniellae]RAY17195.1 acetate kinase [Actinomadura craniellae]
MTRHVLVLNVGSSSIKYALLDPATGHRAAGGLVERIGEDGGRLVHHGPGEEPYERPGPYPDTESALAALQAAFAEAGPDLADARLAAVGHRVVHGGDRYSAPVVIDESVEQTIEELIPLAPLHNPPALAGIRAARRTFPELPHVAVFDTAFHQTLPPAAHTYAVPRDWAAELGVRRYGFHGTSHAYVSRRAAALLGRVPGEVNSIVLHLGNGASVTAVAGGRSVETSMGLTPLEGLVMGTRSGDVDPALPAFLARTRGMTAEETDKALNTAAGLEGLCGARDMREVWRLVDAGDPAAALAIDVYVHRIRKYVGAYYAVLGRVDAVVFTAGVGENDARTRARALAGLERLGIAVDAGRNTAPGGGERFISPKDGEVAVLVVPTDEEREIAAGAVQAVRGA